MHDGLPAPAGTGWLLNPADAQRAEAHVRATIEAFRHLADLAWSPAAGFCLAAIERGLVALLGAVVMAKEAPKGGPVR